MKHAKPIVVGLLGVILLLLGYGALTTIRVFRLEKHLTRLEAPPEEVSRSSEKDGIKYSARYGHKDGMLCWIIFESTVFEFRYPPDIRPIPGGTARHPTLSIVLPDGTQRDLAKSRTIFQFSSSSAFTNRPIDVTLDQLRGFLASSAGEYSIERLEEYVRK